MRCLGLDIGSTSIKGSILDLEHHSIGEPISRPFPNPIPNLPGRCVEIAPDRIEQEVRQVLGQLIDAAPDAGCLLVSGQMGGVILIDDSGAPLTNYLSWRDQRTLEQNDQGINSLDVIRTRWTQEELVSLGSELQPGSVTSLLFWLSQRNRLPSHAMPATVADFVIGRLCQAPPQMHPTQAIGLINLHEGTWHQAAFAALGLDQLRWPQLAEIASPIGHCLIQGRRLACHAALGDQQCALRGAGLGRHELSLNISTGSQVSQRTATFVPGPYQSRCYFDGGYLNTITHIPAGRSLNVLVDLVTELTRAQGGSVADVWNYIAEQAALADGGGLQVDVSFFAGALGSQGHINGITTENLTVGNVFRAALKAMAENYAVCAARLAPDFSRLTPVLSGGLTRAMPLLKQLIQSRFAQPVRESQAAEETLLGLLDVARSVYR